MVVLDLSQYDGFDVPLPVDSSKFSFGRVNDSTVQISATEAGSYYVKRRIPGPLPVGSKAVFTCEMRKLSGSNPQISIDSYSMNDYSISKVIESSADSYDSDEFEEVKVSVIIKPGQQYLQLVIGYFSSRFGLSQIRAPKIEFHGVSESTIFPQHTFANYSRVWSVQDINREWAATVDSGQVVDRTDPELIKFVSNGELSSQRAFIEHGATGSSSDTQKCALRNINPSRGFSVSIQAQRYSGFPLVAAKFTDSVGSTTQTMYGAFFGQANDWQSFYFPPRHGAENAEISIGFTTGVSGDFDLKGIKIEQYGAASNQTSSSLVPIIATLKKVAGTWIINDDSVGSSTREFSEMGVTDVTQTSTYILFKYKSTGYKPNLIPSIDSTRMGEFGVGFDSIDEDSAILRVRDFATNNVVDPSSLPDDTLIQIIGFGVA